MEGPPLDERRGEAGNRAAAAGDMYGRREPMGPPFDDRRGETGNRAAANGGMYGRREPMGPPFDDRRGETGAGRMYGQRAAPPAGSKYGRYGEDGPFAGGYGDRYENSYGRRPMASLHDKGGRSPARGTSGQYARGPRPPPSAPEIDEFGAGRPDFRGQFDYDEMRSDTMFAPEEYGPEYGPGSPPYAPQSPGRYGPRRPAGYGPPNFLPRPGVEVPGPHPLDASPPAMKYRMDFAAGSAARLAYNAADAADAAFAAADYSAAAADTAFAAADNSVVAADSAVAAAGSATQKADTAAAAANSAATPADNAFAS